MNTTSKILTAFAVGAAAGAVLGILFAPDKGSATRHKISERGKKFADSVKEKINMAKENCDELREEVKKAAKEPVNNFQEV